MKDIIIYFLIKFFNMKKYKNYKNETGRRKEFKFRINEKGKIS